MKTLNCSQLLLYSRPSPSNGTTWRIMIWLLLLISATAIVVADVDNGENLWHNGSNNVIIGQIIQENQDFNLQDFESDRPCPEAKDIYPCTCYYNENSNYMDIDCWKVESGDQLKQVFQNYFPSHKFRRFDLQNNKNVKIIESNIFGDVSFEIIYIINCEIEIVEADAFISSQETLNELDIEKTKINSFPLEDIRKFSNLRRFFFVNNYLDQFPLENFHGLTSLETLLLDWNIVAFTGYFENIPNLQHLYFSGNNLQTVPANFFQTGSSNQKTIAVKANQITSVEANAFAVVEGLLLDLKYNLLKTIDEVTWRSVLEGGVNVRLGYNPLDCGCDVAWLFEDDHLLGHISNDTTCNDGENIHDLDPAIFYLC